MPARYHPAMRALRITRWHEEAELVEVEEPRPGPGQVVVKVGAAGACHSDLHLMHGTRSGPPPFPVPFTLGHENAGWVHALGEGVSGVEQGQAVAVYGAWGCGHCVRCQVGMDNYCEDSPTLHGLGAGGGLGADGGMAEYLLVPDARHLVPLPAGLSPEKAAPLTDAGLTPYHAIRRSLPKLDPTATAVVIGVGGLGHLAVQLLKTLTAARIIAVDTKKDALELALSLGADDAVPAGDQAAQHVRTATRGRGADLVLDCVGSDVTLSLAAKCCRSLADLTLIGVAGGSIPFGFLNVPYEVSVQSVYWGSRSELAEVLELGARGRISAKATSYPLEHALDAYRELAQGQIVGRAVVVPHAKP
jgi:alcohol dehydrogenase, propanol-preferring